MPSRASYSAKYDVSPNNSVRQTRLGKDEEAETFHSSPMRDLNCVDRRNATFRFVAPRTRPNPLTVRPPSEDEAEIRAALAELDRGDGVELTANELQHWAETGEWPERLD